MRQVEENFTRGNRGYEELPLVPPVEGIDPAMVGTPQLNLNDLLAQERRAQAAQAPPPLIIKAMHGSS